MNRHDSPLVFVLLTFHFLLLTFHCPFGVGWVEERNPALLL